MFAVRAVLGCARLVLSDRAWIKSVGSHGDDVMVRCNDTLETWYLSCQSREDAVRGTSVQTWW